MRVEVLAPPDESFVVGRDLVGHAKIGSDPDEWENLIHDAGAFTAQRGGTTSRLNALEVGTCSVPVKNADPSTDFRLRSGRRIRLFDEHRKKVLWFGRISDIPSTDAIDYLVTTLAGADAVDELGQSTVKGAGTPGATQTLRERVEELAKVATVPMRYVGNFPALPAPAASTWSVKDWPDGDPLTVTSVAGGGRVTNAVTWNDASVYPVRGWPEFLIEIPTWPRGPLEVSANVSVSLAIDGGATVQARGSVGVYFSPGATPADDATTYVPAGGPAIVTPPLRRRDGDRLGINVRVAVPAGVGSGVATVTITDLAAQPLDGPPDLQSVGMEAPATDHLDMACDSVGAVWRPTLDGVIEVIEGAFASEVVARFSDDPFDENRDCSFTQLQMGFAATDDLINDLSVTNHGPTTDTTRVYTNAASIAAYGRRSGSIDTCLATSDLMDARAAEVLAAASEPRWAPRSLTYAYDDLADVPDLYELVAVTRRGVVHTCQVIGAEHDVAPDPKHFEGLKHLVTLTLRKVA